MSHSAAILNLSDLLVPLPEQFATVHRTRLRLEASGDKSSVDPVVSHRRRKRHLEARKAISSSAGSIWNAIDDHHDWICNVLDTSPDVLDNLARYARSIQKWVKADDDRYVAPLDSFEKPRKFIDELTGFGAQIRAALPIDGHVSDSTTVPEPCERLRKRLIDVLVQACIVAGYEERFKRLPRSRHDKLHTDAHNDLGVLRERIQEAKDAIPGVAKNIDPFCDGPPGKWTSDLKQDLSNLDGMCIRCGWKFLTLEPERFRTTIGEIHDAQCHLGNFDYSAIPCQDKDSQRAADRSGLTRKYQPKPTTEEQNKVARKSRKRRPARSGLRGLNERQLKAIDLKDRGWTLAQIADELGIKSPSAVSGLLKRGRAAQQRLTRDAQNARSIRTDASLDAAPDR